MSDHTKTWVEFLRAIDEASAQREREKVAAMSEAERERYLRDRMIQDMVNMPSRG